MRWLSANDSFPPVEQALQSPNGLLAAGADLTPARLLDAYARGIFPWYSTGEPVLWWSPDPREVLFPAEIHISRSLRRVIGRGGRPCRADHLRRSLGGEAADGCHPTNLGRGHRQFNRE